MEAYINILLLGRSGAGKSSLANYLYSQEIFKTGDGSPVTPFGQAMQKASINRDGYTLNVYDAPGLEPANYRRWKDEITGFVGKQSAFDTDPSQWIHAAFYVINAASKRVEPAEIEIIKDFPIEFHFPISVVLTNCDAADQNSIKSLRDYLKEKIHGIEISEVCSIERKKRGGESILPYGKEELLRKHAEGLAFYFTQRIGIQLFGTLLPNALRKFASTTKERIMASDIGLLSIIRDADKALDSIFDFDELERSILQSKAIKDLEIFTNRLDAYTTVLGAESHLFDDILDNLTNFNIDDEIERLAPKINDIMKSLESDSILDKIRGVCNAGWFCMTIKSQICEIVDNFESFAHVKCINSKAECEFRLAGPEASRNYYAVCTW